MLSILPIVLPVFLVIGGGYAAVRLGGFRAEAVDGLLAFTARFAVPTLLLLAMLRLDLGRAFSAPLLVSFYTGSIGCFVIGAILARTVWRRRPGEAVSVGFQAMFSNTLLIGLPVITLAFGDPALPPAFAIIALHAPVGYAIGIVTMEIARRDGAGPLETARRAAREIFSNALAIGLGLGLGLNLLGVVLPAPVLSALDLLADAALPAALFGLGGALTRYRLREDFGEAAAMAGLSLLLHPLIAWTLSAGVFDLAPEQVAAAVVMAAMPTGMNGYVFASLYHRAEGTAASAMLLGTAASVFTIAFWLWLLR